MLRPPRVLLLSAVACASIAIAAASGTAQAAAPSFAIVSGPGIDQPVRLSSEESFAFMFGTVVEIDAEALDGGEYLGFALFWFVPAGIDAVDDDPDEAAAVGANQYARLYLGTDSEPPLLIFRDRNPFGWPVRQADFARRIGPHPLDILAAHGVPLALTDPFRLADPADDPPAVFADGRQILPVALPAAGSGGLAGESGNGPQPLLWASLAALAAVTGGAGLRFQRRRR